MEVQLLHLRFMFGPVLTLRILQNAELFTNLKEKELIEEIIKKDSEEPAFPCLSLRHSFNASLSCASLHSRGLSASTGTHHFIPPFAPSEQRHLPRRLR